MPKIDLPADRAREYLMFSAAIPLKLILIAAISFVFISSANAQPTSRLRTKQPDAINAIQFSPDGKVLAIAWGADESRVELWDTATGNVQRTIKGFDGPVWSVSFSPDGRTLVTASGGAHPKKIAEKAKHRAKGDWFTEIKWWDWRAGELLNRLELPDDQTVSVIASYSPDGRELAVVENRINEGLSLGDYMGPWATWAQVLRQGVFGRLGFFYSRLSLVDARNGDRRLRLKDGFNTVRVPQFSSFRYAPSLWFGERLMPMMFSPDGRLVAGWKSDEGRLWNSTTGAEVGKLTKFKGHLISLAFSPDSRLIAGAVENVSFKNDQAVFKSEITVWEVSTGALKKIIPVSTHAVSNLVFASNGQQLLIGGLQFAVNRSYASMELVDLETGSVGKIVSNEEGDVSSIALAPDGRSLALQTNTDTVKLLTTDGWRTMHTFSATDDKTISSSTLSRFLVSVKSIPAVAFGADGKTVIGAVEEGGFKLWDARTGEVKKIFATDIDSGAAPAISRNGATAAEISADGVRVWDVATGASRNLAADNPIALSLSADGETLAVAESGRIRIVSVRQLETRRVINGVESSISFIALSADAKNVAAAANGTVKIWNEDGSLKQTIAAGGEVSAVQFGSADQIAIGRKDGGILLCSIARGVVVLELKKHTAAVNAISFSTDGTLMASGGDDRTAIIWDNASGKELHALKGHDLAITSLTFSPDEESLAVGSGNAVVVLWHVAKGKLDRLLR